MPSQISAASAEEITGGGGNATSPNGKPVFIAAEKSLFSTTDKEGLSEIDKIRWREFQLARTTAAITRRDNVYKQMMNEYYTGGSVTTLVLGTPFPIIEPYPHIMDTFKAVRWYEYCASAAAGIGYSFWLRSRAGYRYDKNPRGLKVVFPLTLSLTILTTFAHVYGLQRLMGLRENDYEARKFGVLDDAENLKRKAKNWARFAAYKEEWMRRYNLNAFCERPEETCSLLSPCWLKYSPVQYNTTFDYPPRKNPYFLSTIPLKDTHAEWNFIYEIPRNGKGVPQVDARPELQHVYKNSYQYEDLTLNRTTAGAN